MVIVMTLQKCSHENVIEVNFNSKFHKFVMDGFGKHKIKTVSLIQQPNSYLGIVSAQILSKMRLF